MSPTDSLLQTENTTDLTSGHVVLMFTYSQVLTLSKEGKECGSVAECLLTNHKIPGSNPGDTFSFWEIFHLRR